MPKILLFISAVFVLFQHSAFAQESFIDGVLTGSTQVKTLVLYKGENGQKKEIARSPVDSKGNFHFAFSQNEEGFITLGTENLRSWVNTFYMKPGDKLNVEIATVGYKLVGKNTSENELIAQWDKSLEPLAEKCHPVKGRESTFRDFFPLLESKIKEMDTYKAATTANNSFDKLFAHKRLFDIASLAASYTRMGRKEYPKVEDYPEFYYRPILKNLTTTPFILGMVNGMDILDMWENMSYMTTKRDGVDDEKNAQEMTNKYIVSNMITPIMDPTVKGEKIISVANKLKSYTGFVGFVNKYEKYMAIYTGDG